MAKAKRVKGEWKRLTVQAAAFLLQNPMLHRFFLGRIETGGTKSVCVPGLNCYSCPAAIGACPLGALQNSMSGGYKKPAFPFYVLGFLILFGLTLGRWICGWLCPFGLVQDLIYRIPFFKKIRTFPYERILRWLKYAVLGVLVIGLPLFSAFKGVLVPYFCKVLCPSGTLFGGVPLVLMNPAYRAQAGALFWWKIGVCAALLLLSLLISRPFCRYLCPLGVIYGMFNRIALVHLAYQKDPCVGCGACEAVCPMGIDPVRQFDSAECIRCGCCARACPTGSLALRFGIRKNAESSQKQCNVTLAKSAKCDRIANEETAGETRRERRTDMTKIDIFSGFLGAGKTTLIKKLIADGFNGEKLVLIENEFGEIGIDGAFLQEAGIEITEMNSGCICCSLVGDFSEALKKVLEQFHPDRILIEPSGVGKLSDVKRAVSGVLSDDVVISSCVAVVDAKKARVYRKNFGEFYVNQIEAADCVVLSRTQDVSEERLKEVLDMVRELNAEATVVAAPWDALSGKDLVKAMESRDTLKASMEALKAEHHHHDEDECDDPECECHHHHHDDDDDDEDEHEHHHHHHDDDDDDDEDEHEHHHHHHHDGEECDDPECECHHHHDDDGDGHGHHHHHHHHGHDADEVFSSWGIETVHRFTEDEIEAKLAKLDDAETYGTVLRAKGVVAAADGGQWIHFDHVPGEVEIRRGPAGVIGRLCVIGSKIKEDALSALFTE